MKRGINFYQILTNAIVDDIRKIEGATWPRKAIDKKWWKLEEAYMSQNTLI